jgi:drug/metabolite transporter (DMT)-like permease
MDNQQRQGMLFVFIAVVGYAFLPTIVKQIQANGMLPLDIAAWRFGFALPILWLIVLARRRPPPVVPLPRRRLLLLGTLMACAAVTAFFALERLPASTLIVLFYTYPTMVALISLFLGERLALQAWLALALTLVGVALTVPDFGAGLTSNDMLGVGLALFNALIVAVYFVINARLLRGHSALMRASAWVITGSFLTMLLVALIRRDVAAPPDAATWAYLLALATVCTVLPIFTLTIGIQKLGASKAAILGTVEPILTVLIAAAVLGERMTAIQVVGGVFVLFSVVLLQVPLRGLVGLRAGKKAAAGEALP